MFLAAKTASARTKIIASNAPTFNSAVIQCRSPRGNRLLFGAACRIRTDDLPLKRRMAPPIVSRHLLKFRCLSVQKNHTEILFRHRF